MVAAFRLLYPKDARGTSSEVLQREDPKQRLVSALKSLSVGHGISTRCRNSSVPEWSSMTVGIRSDHEVGVSFRSMHGERGRVEIPS